MLIRIFPTAVLETCCEFILNCEVIVKSIKDPDDIFKYLVSPRGGGGGTQVQRGPHLRYVFSGRRGLFLRPPHVRDFVKEGYFFVPRYEVWGSKSPYNPRNIRGSDAE